MRAVQERCVSVRQVTPTNKYQVGTARSWQLKRRLSQYAMIEYYSIKSERCKCRHLCTAPLDYIT